MLSYVNLILFVFLIWLMIELGIHYLVLYLRQDFQWLVMSKDELPTLNKKALKKFINRSYDPELGWTRRPNSQGTESTGSIGSISSDYKQVSYRINDMGARENPGHEHLPAVISTYGDSFVFSRQVYDDETWQWNLSKLTQTNVLNFGVGNFGLDQSFLRLQREYDNNLTKLVIMGVVPETIVRVLGVWRHYYEHGNTFAFKPRYVTSSNGLRLIPNLIDKPTKFLDLHKYIDEIRTNDYFYHRKFKRNMLSFPYGLSFVRRPQRHFSLIYALLLDKLYSAMGQSSSRAWELILRDNQQYCVSLYNDIEVVELLSLIVQEFVKFAKQKGFTPIFLLMPYRTDLEYFRTYGTSYYAEFLKNISDVVETIDLTEKLLDTTETIYTNDYYGGHLNALGNQIVATELNNLLRQYL